ncbi:MAG: T9SS type A sorting domain-containing protein, partial [Candidatus Cloacimonetes bacterium]|nr:T9SS type A sorting domain-containing protein [Candidatus Cloacimonadota bacterium]
GDKNPATSYKVYFGTAPQLMIEVDDDADLFWATGVLLPDTWYYWKIIPYNGFGQATGVTTWSFQTRDALGITEATNPTPANNELIIVPVTPGFPYIVNLDWDSIHEGSATFDVLVMAPGELDYTLLTNTANSYAQYQADLAGMYLWKVITNWTDPGTKNMPAASREIFDSKEAPNVWAFRLALEGTIPDIPADGSADVDGGPAAGGATVETDIDLWNQPIIPPEIIFVLAPIYNINDTIVLSYSGTGIGNITITVGPGTWWGAVYYNNNWHWADIPDRLSQPLVVLTGNTGEFVFNNVDFGAKGDVVFLLGEGDGPLPVEFSSFTAVVTSQYFVKLHWTTQTETNLAGYYVYRNTVNNLETATQFPQMISGTNTSQEANYSYVDKEVETGNTYYYWLQAVDMNNTHMFHGPISVEVTGQAAPVLPEISVLKNAYPNPLSTGNVNFNVEIRKGETGTVTVYNILGQAVKTFKVTEGKKTFTWDAKGVANGIYFYKLTTPTVTSAAKKLVILK